MYTRQAKVVIENNQRKFKTTARGYEVLRDPALNKGTSFSLEERKALDLTGILPPVVTTDMELQCS